MSPGSITISDLQRSVTRELLELFPGDEAVSVTRLIFDHFGYPPIEIAKNPGAILQNKIHSEIKKIVHELGRNRPIQYILGSAHFFDLELEVNGDVLIPRPETEELVSLILVENRKSKPGIIDLGTGSGCIAIALAENIPGSDVHALEIKPKALAIARRNADKYGGKVQFHQGDLLADTGIDPANEFDIIVSNPPYVTGNDRLVMAPNVVDHEPASALFVPDDDPLVFFRAIARFAARHLADDGMIWAEINEKFGPDTANVFKQAGFNDTRVIKDIHGKDRFIKSRKHEG